MQCKDCHHFAEQMKWTIVHEEQEEGVSGHKVRTAANAITVCIAQQNGMLKQTGISLIQRHAM